MSRAASSGAPGRLRGGGSILSGDGSWTPAGPSPWAGPGRPAGQRPRRTPLHRRLGLAPFDGVATSRGALSRRTPPARVPRPLTAGLPCSWLTLSCPSGQLLELALRTPPGRRCPQCGSCLLTPSCLPVKLPRASACAPQPRRGPAAPNRRTRPSPQASRTRGAGVARAAVWASAGSGQALEWPSFRGPPFQMFTHTPPQRGRLRMCPGRPRPHLGEWGGWANGQSSCPARAAECPGSQESMAPVSSGWSARARGAVGPGPPASQAGSAAAPSAGPGEHCGSLGAASPRVPGGLRQSRAGWHVSSTVQSRALSPGATVTSQPLRLQSWPGWQDQTGRVPAVTRLVRSSCGSGR